MCKHADQTAEFIQHLLENVYPCLDLKIHNAISCTYLNEYQQHQREHLIDLMHVIRNDFNALVSCEQKLVFPSVMKVFGAKTASEAPIPNLIDLMQLTRSKEHKIMGHVQQLVTLLDTNTWKQGAIKQHDLAESFTNSFLKEKNRWNKMIDDRLTACSCFRANLFKGLGIQQPMNNQKN